MQRTLTTAQPAEFTGASIAPAWPLRLLSTLRLWSQRVRTCHQLAQLDEGLPADAGVSTCEREAELAKPFRH